MREILFMGFQPDENGTQIAVVNGKEYKGEWVEGCYVYDNNLNHHIRAFDNCYYAVIPETVCGWTGLKDKNGKRIFEGDILQLCKATYPCLVYWNGTGWSIKRNGKRVIYDCDMDIAHDLRNMEVIGNAFEVVE